MREHYENTTRRTHYLNSRLTKCQFEIKNPKLKLKLGLNILLFPMVSILFFFPLRVLFLSQNVLVVFIKTKIIPLLKFCQKLNGTSRQHKLNVITYNIINVLKKLKKIKSD
jgi:hypothetical protein